MFCFAIVWFQIVIETVSSCGNVVINEVNADTPGQQEVSGEFIELWNSGNCAVDLDGCEIALYSGHSDTPTRYRNFNLTSYCIPGNGYFLIGGSSLPHAPDITENTPGFIENGNNRADCVALYKGFSDTSLFKVDNNLVDLIIYDRLSQSNTSAYMPSYPKSQEHVFENEAFVSGDEGMSRCCRGSTDMSGFSVRRLTPGAPNTCLTEVLARWPSPCPDVVFTSPPTMRSRSIHYKTLTNMKGTSPVIASQHVKSVIQCSVMCSQTNMCTHYSYVKKGEGSNTGTCELHSHCKTEVEFSTDGIVGEKYYTTSATNPVWPYEDLKAD